MEYTKTPAGIMIPKSNEFDLMQTLDCGQSFRWEPCNEKSNRIGGIAFGRYLELEESDKHILFCDTEEDDFLHIWVPYFDLELDYKTTCLNWILFYAKQHNMHREFVFYSRTLGRRYAVLLFHKITTFLVSKELYHAYVNILERRYLAVLHFPHRKFLQTAQWKI